MTNLGPSSIDNGLGDGCRGFCGSITGEKYSGAWCVRVFGIRDIGALDVLEELEAS